MTNERWLLLLVLLAIVPWAVVLLIALLRGYDVNVTLHRKPRHYDEEGPTDDHTNPG